MLDAPTPREKLIERAAMFLVDSAVDRYLQTMSEPHGSVRAETRTAAGR